eukprot:2846857-Amphidinium_carterae.1
MFWKQRGLYRGVILFEPTCNAKEDECYKDLLANLVNSRKISGCDHYSLLSVAFQLLANEALSQDRNMCATCWMGGIVLARFKIVGSAKP